jgi:hypothetical protein
MMAVMYFVFMSNFQIACFITASRRDLELLRQLAKLKDARDAGYGAQP